MKRRAVGNPLGLAVLAGLLEEPMHPYEMARRFVEYGKEKDFKYTRSSLYMVVGQLEKAGFIAEQETLRDTARPAGSAGCRDCRIGRCSHGCPPPGRPRHADASA
ncbi:hypothetical protein ACFQ1S_22060 [Kibdelosporangium lantanae]|uniref:Transcription regulator PadR N-terminal domain-containing protein n=1 Tax=Kibdelosporangium lantanae TaxID=1497396 RepID=A0ABW3MEH4_9PSEU